MNVTALEAAIRLWHDRMADLEEWVSEVARVMGTTPADSRMSNVIYPVANGYLEALNLASGAGIDGWLEWWWLECHLSNNPLNAIVGDTQYRVDSIDVFIQVILADQALAKSDDKAAVYISEKDIAHHMKSIGINGKGFRC